MAEEAVARLGSGSSLNGIGLGSYEGRVDLRELSVPVPARLRRFESQGWFVEVLGDLVVFRGVEGQAAAIMRQQGLDEATLYINKVPCGGVQGCDYLLPRTE